jgi:hypothetical protein
VRFSRKRKLSPDFKSVNVYVSNEARDMLERIAGPDSLGATVEELIVREYRRRERKLTQQVQDFICTKNDAVASSPRAQ